MQSVCRKDVWWMLGDVFVVLALYNCFLLVNADIEHHCDTLTYMRGTHPDGICGSDLPNALNALCGSYQNVNVLGAVKRNTANLNTLGMGEVYSRREGNQNLLHRALDKRRALSVLDKRGYFVEEGVACECCYHRCDIYELAQYCFLAPSFL